MDEPARILIVDDDESARRSLTLIFGRQGYETDAAATGEEALTKAEDESFNLAILDIKLPDVEGVDLILPLKEMQPDLMVIMATAYASLDTALRAMHASASGYVTKPLNVDEVLATVRGALKSQRLALAERRAEEEVRKLNEELEERVRQRTSELKSANEELEAFAYSVSHDLRAPLRAIDGFARILTEEHAPDLPDEAKRYLRLVRNNSQHMSDLIDDLLAFSRLSRQPLEKKAVAPADLLQKALAELGTQREGRRIEINVGDLPICQADPALLTQVFVNLLSNALKFTAEREEALIEIGSREANDPAGECAYFVKDNGVGFDMQYASKLFGVFQRLHRIEDYGGTGVGLAIVQRIIHRHGGQVWAEAEADEGATFYFTLGGGTTHTPSGFPQTERGTGAQR